MSRMNTGRYKRAKKIVSKLIPKRILLWQRIRRNQKHFGDRDYREIFVRIYEENHWNNSESFSGGGSTVDFTESIRSELEEWLRRNQIRSLVDIPCGDFNWMQKVHLPDDCQYIGMDIVEDLIESNNEQYADANYSFRVGDVIADKLPIADVYFCRDVFIHFPNSAIETAIQNIKATGAKFLIATTFPFIKENIDTEFPTSRHHNLEFQLGEPLELLKDFGNKRTDKYMGVWRL